MDAGVADRPAPRQGSVLVGHLSLGRTGHAVERRSDGTVLIRALEPLGPDPARLNEVTDRGSINQRTMPGHRAGLVALLYDAPDAARVIVAYGVAG